MGLLDTQRIYNLVGKLNYVKTKIDSVLSATSNNPVANSVITEALDDKLSKTQGGTVSGDTSFTGSLDINSCDIGGAGINMLHINDSLTLGSYCDNFDANGRPVIHIPTPQNSDDAANKEYVDQQLAQAIQNVLSTLGVNNDGTNDTPPAILPLVDIDLIPMEQTYPDPTVYTFTGLLNLTQGDWLTLEIKPDKTLNTTITQGVQVINLKALSEGMGDRLGIGYQTDDACIVVIINASEIDFENGSVNGSGNTIVYCYNNIDAMGSFTLRQATEEEISNYSA